MLNCSTADAKHSTHCITCVHHSSAYHLLSATLPTHTKGGGVMCYLVTLDIVTGVTGKLCVVVNVRNPELRSKIYWARRTPSRRCGLSAPPPWETAGGTWLGDPWPWSAVSGHWPARRRPEAGSDESRAALWMFSRSRWVGSWTPEWNIGDNKNYY